MPDNLREFIYLDDISVNSHLSSLGVGKPQEIVDISESEVEKSGGADVKVLKGGGSSTDSSSTEMIMSATAPYRFERLLQELTDEDVTIHENPTPEEVGRGDVVRIDGEFTPMSLYKIEIGINALFELVDEDTAQSVAEMDISGDEGSDSGLGIDQENIPGSRDTGDDQDDVEALAALYQMAEIFRDLAEELIGDEVPVRIEYESGSAVSLLDRSNFEVPHKEAFLETERYVIFGRVEERIPRNTDWDPIRASNIMDRYFENQDTETFRDDWEGAAENMGMTMESEDLLIEGRSLVVHPIALYW
jgi:hypothetical protein